MLRKPLRSRQLLFGYAQEDMQAILAPLARNAEEPVSSMGNDTPIAALTNRKPLLYSYFKQLFAQVTNPPLDAIREELVTSMSTALGPEKNGGPKLYCVSGHVKKPGVYEAAMDTTLRQLIYDYAGGIRGDLR